MAQVSATNGASASAAASAPALSRQEVQAALSQFDAKINQMGGFPAKDIINALTKLAERTELAQDIVSFLETKIHRVAPQYKLPIFYLTDSILKNVRGPYPSLFGRVIVPLYCNCVKQVSGKDLRRFIHVLNTWEQTRLFAPEALASMRASANRAQALAEPAEMAQSASFASAAGSASTQQRRSGAAAPAKKSAQQTQDMELRSLLTKLQNDMDIHPTEHMSLEEVRANNPEFYAQLLEFHAADHAPQEQQQQAPPAQPHHAPPLAVSPPVVALPPGPVLGGPPPGPPRGPSRPPMRDPRRSDAILAPPVRLPPRGPVAMPVSVPPKSANAAHLTQLMARKQAAPAAATAPLNEVTNDPPRAPDPAAVMSILQKLKGMTQHDAPSTTAAVPSAAPVSLPTAPIVPPPRGPLRMPPPPPPAFLHARPPPQFLVPPPPRPLQMGIPPPPPAALLQQQQQALGNDTGASRMWFSDTVVNHKDRVESNVQKLYAALPLVCRDSGLRFKDQDKLNAHLDFLFQYNRSLKERSRGGISRSWYPDEDQWVTDCASATAPRESTSSSFFDRKEAEDDDMADATSWDHARVPVDESVTKCRICGESFAKSWDEDEEDWMYTNAVVGTIHNPSVSDGSADYDTIFHKYCYDTVTSHSKHITLEHLIPGSPQSLLRTANGQTTATAAATTASVDRSSSDAAGVKRALEDVDEDSDSDEDVKRIRTA